MFAAFKKGDDALERIIFRKQVLAHHIVQFISDDDLDPERVYEIGRQTMLELARWKLWVCDRNPHG